MEFARRGRPATVGASVDDDGRRSPDPMLPHGISPATEDLVDECLRTSGGNNKAAGQENAAPDEYKVQESSETMLPMKTFPSSVKWTCSICQVKATSQGNLRQHFAGQKHWSKVASLVSRNNAKSQKAKETVEKSGNALPMWACRFCQSNCTCQSDLENHMKGKRHQRNIRALMEECKNMESNYASPTWTCSLCQARCTGQSVLENHLRGKRHRLNFLLLQVEEAKLYLSGNALPMWACRFCQSNCTCQSDLENHMKGKRHQRNILALMEECKNMESNYASPTWTCSLCQARCTGQSVLENHLRGKRHRLNFLLLQVEEAKLYLSLSFCKVCNLQCSSEKMLAHHRTGKKHLAKLNGC
ncbi:hypothetical protein PVAP13_8KG141801 [Panicum virgatum]|uniref:C2H2-type domain-containing protein n=2 Tax=Panicum virgatum TaxID=38727 RepID=A0A8T0PI51_PANVG|nr:hypothetical protein PVAP13_8KG141801 [Panicum virgatum]